MKKDAAFRAALKYLRHFFIIFLIVAFTTTCCTMLFVTALTNTLGITLTGENLSTAAKVTFVNVVLLSLLFTLIDIARRRLTVDRPVKGIIQAAEKIMQGDFSIRLQTHSRAYADKSFRQIAECLNKIAAELGSVETLRTDFITNVSHELKTPLAVIGNYAAMLRQPGITEDEKQEYAVAISDSAKKLAQLVSNILKLNKLENQQIFPQAEEYDLAEQLRESLLQFEDAWEQKDLTVEVHIEDNVHIRSDPELLSLVWNNLISNAVKFTPRGGTVCVGLQIWGEQVAVSVSDTGCGMKPETGLHIFEKFYQGDTSHAAQGNGLGLALVKRVVDILGGEITVQSVYGQGSTFTVTVQRY